MGGPGAIPLLQSTVSKTGLILTGGGARAAYQVGVLKGVREILAGRAVSPPENPFKIICGTSAGAVNAGALAVYANDFGAAVEHMLGVWEHFHVHHVYRSDFLGNLLSGRRGFRAPP